MKSKILLSILCSLFQTALSQDFKNFFEKINDDFIKFNHIGAEIAWNTSVNPGNADLAIRAANYQKKREKWQKNTCDRLVELREDQMLNVTQNRQAYLLCRGPGFTFEEARAVSNLYEQLQSTYSDAQICFQAQGLTSKSNLTTIEDAIKLYLSTVNHLTSKQLNDSVETAAKLAANDRQQKSEDLFCLNGEEEVDKLMKFSKNEKVLRFLWLAWREVVGPSMREPYKKLVTIENKASRRNVGSTENRFKSMEQARFCYDYSNIVIIAIPFPSIQFPKELFTLATQSDPSINLLLVIDVTLRYADIGASWRDEVEVSDLRALCRRLYEEIKPLYAMLHGIVRFYLRKHYGDAVTEYGPLPAHLLGSLWSQNWEPLSELILRRSVDLDTSIASLNWTVQHMVKRAEDFYQSLGLPPMTETFWRKSVLARESSNTRCHGTAADMFQDGDFRLLYCSGTSMEDLYVVHHEMGHIQYYMSYEKQPGIFRQANSFLHESIGDTIMLGAMSPQHLHRLGLINDSLLYEQGGFDDNDEFGLDDGLDESRQPTILEILLLKAALNKLPQLPFALLIDEYRWKYFEGGIEEESLNEEFWRMARDLQGVAPSSERGENYFDVAAKFHVPDNTPYIRYFLSGILQYQLHERSCAAAVFGRRDVTVQAPPSVHLAACDVYGSKANGRFIRDLMSRGHSQHWREILSSTTGSDEISTSALKRYYRPLYKLLKRMIQAYRIPIGW